MCVKFEDEPHSCEAQVSINVWLNSVLLGFLHDVTNRRIIQLIAGVWLDSS